MLILGIESSADDTCAAIVQDGYKLLANAIASSIDLHIAFGGIVPEIASRSHLEVILPTIQAALDQAKLGWGDIDAIGVTCGPGLSGSLLIGVLTARTLAIAKKLPLIAVNHVEAHVYANFITDGGPAILDGGYKLAQKKPEFPLLSLIVSGGHTQLVLFKNHSKYQLLGQTRDDAVGEAFDKVAKILGLPYPGGPSISRVAESGDPHAFKLPKAKMGNPYEFSYSGLKTAVLRAVQAACGKRYDFPSFELAGLLNERQKADVAASFQRIAIETLVNGLKLAAEEHSPKTVVIAGGVAANQELRRQITALNLPSVLYPDIKLCTDNAAMIASLAYFKYQQQQIADPYSLEIEPNLSM
jgi:N6-L-threonylcarbamoyladenine synthase